MSHRYFAVHKPKGIVSQFVSSHEVGLLGDLDFTFPEGTHAIGRLDKDSEGLLLLTTDKSITRRLFEGPVPHRRTYLVLVKGKVAPETLKLMAAGIGISAKDNETYQTAPSEAQMVTDPAVYSPYIEPYPDHIPHSWLLLTLTEGKFHQVRKMVGAAGHRCKRLIRVSIEDLQLGNIPPGGVVELDQQAFFERLRI